MKILVTGFDTFGTHAFNPAEEIVRRLAAAPPTDSFETLATLVVPTEYDSAVRHTLAAIDAERPDSVLMFGLAAESGTFRIERLGRNAVNPDRRDNRDVGWTAGSIVADAPETYPTVVDIPALHAALSGEGVTPTLSDDAGGYVCNFLYFSVLHAIAANRRPERALFVHVPWAFEDDEEPDLDRHESEARALLRALRRIGG